MKRTKLIEEREKTAMSQADMAEKLGISRSLYGHIENGLRNPTYGLAKAIGKILNVGFDELFFDADCFRVKQNVAATGTEGR